MLKANAVRYCPYCAETIPTTGVNCPICGKRLAPLNIEDHSGDSVESMPSGKQERWHPYMPLDPETFSQLLAQEAPVSASHQIWQHRGDNAAIGAGARVTA